MDELLLAARIVLAGVFAAAGVAKLLDLPGSRRAVADFGISERFAPAIGTMLPLAELAVAGTLLAAETARWAATGALALLFAFSAGIALAMSRGQAPDCHCFGQVHSAPAGPGALVRNLSLAVPAALIAVEGPGPSIGSWIADRTSAEGAAVGAGIVAFLLAALALTQFREVRRLRSELDGARQELAALPAGLPVGASAPNFALSSIGGGQRTLEELCARGLPVTLLFLDSECETCQGLIPDVARWQRMLAGNLTLALITGPGSKDEEFEIDGHAIADVLVQEDSEVMRAYRIESTPSAVSVTPERAIASTPAEGPLAIEPLIRLTLKRFPDPAPVIQVVHNRAS